MQQSERCDGSNLSAWDEMLPGEQGKVSTKSPLAPGGTVCGAWHSWQSRGTVLPGTPAWGDPREGISSPTKPTRCSHRVSSCSRAHMHKHPCAHTQHHSTSPALSPSPGLAPSLGAGISIPLGPGHSGCAHPALVSLTACKL